MLLRPQPDTVSNYSTTVLRVCVFVPEPSERLKNGARRDRGCSGCRAEGERHAATHLHEQWLVPPLSERIPAHDRKAEDRRMSIPSPRVAAAFVAVEFVMTIINPETRSYAHRLRHRHQYHRRALEHHRRPLARRVTTHPNCSRLPRRCVTPRNVDERTRRRRGRPAKNHFQG